MINMINLLPEEEKKEERPKKMEEPRIEMVQPKKPEPDFKISSPEKSEPKRDEIKLKPATLPEQKIKPSAKEKKSGLFAILWKKIFGKKTSAPPKTREAKEKMQLSKSFAPAGLEVTLMPKEIPITKRMVQERILIFLAAIAVSVLIVFIIWVWATWRSEEAQFRVSQIKTEMATIEAQIASYNNEIEEIKKLEKKAEQANDLLANHIYWTKFFKLLENYTIPDIYYGDFTGDTKGKIVLPTIGRDLIAAARQLIAFSNTPDFVKEVTITDLVGGIKGVTFNTNLILNPEVFLKK
ncbi:MAG: hypothetical protein ACP5IX_00880 [Patescibacteria group bacterium]